MVSLGSCGRGRCGGTEADKGARCCVQRALAYQGWCPLRAVVLNPRLLLGSRPSRDEMGGVSSIGPSEVVFTIRVCWVGLESGWMQWLARVDEQRTRRVPQSSDDGRAAGSTWVTSSAEMTRFSAGHSCSSSCPTSRLPDCLLVENGHKMLVP